ncbi:MAG: Asp-tRNA(Asn)/Glu-tRNA(Gln) amidotransferase subunit GatA [Candidatus Omnitrophica bacterium]|nr:Asp-tRNA(Asn)/Glu-tRNA(Gln) amidotransferase subunit GatA [Candidatus Omnitrophota bacterium]MDD5310765.1 Asp-tRNA(Asn)/Glu-tRNA(Gln) amidotransferase subunit GatA [Candidatus Omnitrophota bacterium]MDD5545552.1 Asp-tRNA(Asn)/Glu-tRNA(Gln) amidotransferase subunit GatA [Candidatus Omnitrophota bacterium]
MDNLYSLTAGELLGLLDKKTIKPEEIIESVYSRAQSVDKKIKGYLNLDREKALSRAKSLPSSGKLKGIPVAVKDNICVEGELTTCASKILRGFKPPYNATVIEKLKSEGAVIFGKTNMDEFAFGSSCENSSYFPTLNPWDTARIPGGSSGGSAAVVSADEAVMAIGSDTGGSIRQPASLCGVVGMKPTYGRVSRYGLIAFASSLDQIGPLTKDIKDAALLLGVIAGFDEKDSTSVNVPVPDYASYLKNDVKGVKIGIPKEYFVEGMDKEVEASVREAIALLKGKGAQIVDVSLPHTEYAVAVYYILATAEASSNLARFDGVQYGYRCEDPANLLDMYERTRGEGFGAEAKRRIILGTYVLSSGYYDAYYLKAQKVRMLIKNDFEQVFKSGCDCILTPTSPTPAFKVGERSADPLSMYLSDIFTISVNLAGVPALSMPCGFTKSGLPIGMQLIGNFFEEGKIFNAAYAYESNTDWHKRSPKL